MSTKSPCVAITDSPIFKNSSTANAQCVPVQVRIVSEKNCKIIAGQIYYYHLHDTSSSLKCEFGFFV